ncbi:hypothetical protein ATANTOWER_028092 [Ataeniobius toweri]|uniref:Uncharacterized protein n=1 Tax=Ataeniobius toweri TaxID=208326 RepID=A0ABU7C4M8_9TELE|nr:hypothetical protein [Ataeniobius toweri]
MVNPAGRLKPLIPSEPCSLIVLSSFMFLPLSPATPCQSTLRLCKLPMDLLRPLGSHAFKHTDQLLPGSLASTTILAEISTTIANSLLPLPDADEPNRLK